PEIEAVVEAKRLLLEDVEEGDVLGRVVFRTASGDVGSVPLTAEERAAAPEKSSVIDHFIPDP
ncbi:MAG: hypothetical protein J6V24_02410, partial [Clostridia bacterium]|nr:hypothetical protein [Clostridia bacterium]